MSTTAGAPDLSGQRLPGWSAVILILVVGVLGGGGSSARPLFEALCHLGGFLVLAVLVVTGRDVRIDPSARAWLGLAIAAFALPLVQLLPLPGALSAGLPGRELATAIRAEVGATGPWPISLDPDRTVIAALSLVPGIAMFAATLRCGEQWRRRFIFAWIAVALVSVMVGALQVASSGSAAQIYDTLHRDAAIGFFANRNHQSVFLLSVLLMFVAALVLGTQSRTRPAMLLRAGLVILLVAGLFITRSRAGLLLLVIAVPALILFAGRGRLAWRPSWPVTAAAFAILAAVGAFIAFNPVARAVLSRFSSLDDSRLIYWPDVVYTLGQVWPVGSGFGTFQALFATQERIGTIDEFYLNHAHNEYLELAIEGGIVAVLLIAVFLVMLALRIRAVSGWNGDARRLAVAGAIAICAVLLHSLVDYPLRAITMTAMFGFSAGLLFRPAARLSDAEPS